MATALAGSRSFPHQFSVVFFFIILFYFFHFHIDVKTRAMVSCVTVRKRCVIVFFGSMSWLTNSLVAVFFLSILYMVFFSLFCIHSLRTELREVIACAENWPNWSLVGSNSLPELFVRFGTVFFSSSCCFLLRKVILWCAKRSACLKRWKDYL